MTLACPKCGKTTSKVIETRHTDGLIRRRRECCGVRWNTYEGCDDAKWEELLNKVHKYRQALADIRSALGGTHD